jgi:predicted esterase YcpF (UPF0227 family)
MYCLNGNKQMNHIVYFHGFASSPNSSKVDELKKHYSVFAPHVSNSNQSEILENQIMNWMVCNTNPGDKILFVGTSLGGYWAARMANLFDGKALIFNPSIDPSKDLKQYIGFNTNWSTNELFYLNEKCVETFVSLSDDDKKYVELAVICKNDNVVDSKAAIEFFDNAEILDSDDHRFSDINLMLEYVKTAFDSIREENSSSGDY